jgi:hypothetical protein
MKRTFGPMASPIAAMVVVAVFVATACTAGQEVASETAGSTTRGSPTPAQSVAASSAGASASPSPSTALLAWNPASLEEDWPAPVRAEPDGGVTVVPILRSHEDKGRYEDPTGDTGSGAFPWVDIRVVSFCHNFACPMVLVPAPPDVDPAEQWIAYGVVVDDDGDGVADRRFGIDNIPAPEAVQGHHRVWITDLHTGKTVSAVRGSDSPPVVGGTFLTTSYPVAAPVTEPTRSAPCEGGGDRPPPRDVGLAAAVFGLGGDTTGGFRGTDSAFFYAWASVIQGGQIAATDYAPDAGWLHVDPSTDAPPSASDADAGAVALPIDSLEEAIVAVIRANAWFGFEPSDTHVPGASSWLEAEARGDGWDVTFVCGPETLYARTTFGDCPRAGCKRTYVRVHVRRDGTVDPRCEWPEGEEAAGCQ